MQNNSKVSLTELTKEEQEAINTKLNAVLAEHQATFYIHQFIINGKIEAALEIYKKEELIPSPLNEKSNSETAKSSESSGGESA